jgi:hypothetical protein
MGGDAVGARFLGQQGGANRIRMVPTAGISHGGDMVNIDAQAQLQMSGAAARFLGRTELRNARLRAIT